MFLFTADVLQNPETNSTAASAKLEDCTTCSIEEVKTVENI